jgi:hypothetical protein
MLFISEFLCYSQSIVFILWIFRWGLSIVFSIILYILYTVISNFFLILLLFFECWYYALHVYVSVWVLLLCVCVCYSLRICVIHGKLFYSPNVILGILLFLERLCYSPNVCVIVTCCCCCYTINVFILCIFAFFLELLYYSLIADILRVLLLFSECQYSVNIYVMLRNLYYFLKVFAVLWMSVLLSYRVLKAYIISKTYFFASRMSVLTYVADKDECYSTVNSEVWDSNPVPVSSSWWRFHKP